MKKILFTAFLFFSMTCYSQKYFAEIKNDTVQRVIVIISAEYAHQLLGGIWVETFINDSTKNYAGKGYVYHPDKQNFSAQKPFPSWILNELLRWQPPISYPTDGRMYIWDEETISWKEITQ